MSSAEHTPGRVSLEQDRDLLAADGHLMCEIYDTAEGLEGSDWEADANAHRLWAAWNAVEDAGLSTGALEDGVVKELLAECRRIHYRLAGLILGPGTIVTDIEHDDYVRLGRVLAKAEPRKENRK